MIGIVVVSHSAKLAEGVVELASAMGGDDLAIKAAGGLDAPDQPLGTDPLQILEAIQAIYSEDGVLVLMDLGSAVLSAEMALELLPEDQRKHILLCEAPIVEGAVVAAVQARIGSSLDQAAAEARDALTAKSSHLGNTPTVAIDRFHQSSPAETEPAEESIQVTLTIHNPLGLHARPAARIVKLAGDFPQARLSIENQTTGSGPANAKSINAIAALEALQDHQILVRAAGIEAQAALTAFQILAEDNFGDDLSGEPPADQPALANNLATTPEGTYRKGWSASTGITIGPAYVFQPALPEIPSYPADHPQKEWDALQQSIARVRAQIAEEQSGGSLAGPTAEIYDVHQLILTDEALLSPTRQAIFHQRLNAAAAWHQAIGQTAARYHQMNDPYLKARAKDVEDLGRQVLTNLLGFSPEAPQFNQPGILIAQDLSVSELARLDPGMVKGICTAAGGAVSHAVIMARSFGFPMITGLGNGILNIPDGTDLILDGETGQVWIDPPESLKTTYTAQRLAAQTSHLQAIAESQAPAVTRDGKRVEIVANVGSVETIRLAVHTGAEGVGLFRTEFLFLDRQKAPSEDEQYAVYRASAQALEGRPLIIRTLDAGGDKVLPYLHLPVEANPFLGLRAIRLCLAQPEMFKDQLRAILRVAAEFPIKIMFPMIATLSEWRAACAHLEEARTELRQGGRPVPDRIETGMMVEIPAAAILAARFAREVDFFSIGTNDLTQYTFAVERGNAHVASLADPFQPAILELIQNVVQAAHEQGKWVGVCGEMAGDPRAIPLLVGLGVDELSMNAPSIPQAKQIVRTLEYTLARSQTAQVLAADR